MHLDTLNCPSTLIGEQQLKEEGFWFESLLHTQKNCKVVLFCCCREDV